MITILKMQLSEIGKQAYQRFSHDYGERKTKNIETSLA